MVHNLVFTINHIKERERHLIKPLVVTLLVSSTCLEFSKDSNRIIDLAHAAKSQAEEFVLPRIYTQW